MTARITQTPVWSTLTAPPEVMARVHEALTFDEPNARFTPQYRRGVWDGTVKFLKKNGQFLTGLTPRVVSVAGCHVEIAPVRVPPRPELVPAVHGIEMRGYQKAAIAAFFAHGGRAALQVPTGGGKTEIGIEIVRRAGHNALWVTHTLDILNQTLERLALRLPHLKVGVLRGSQVEPRFPLTVAMVQTLNSISAGDPFWDAWRMLVLDECHHTGATTWVNISEQLRYAALRLGLSGTAETRDEIRNVRLEGATGPTVKVVSTTDLVNAGFLARPSIRLIRPPGRYPTGAEFRRTSAHGAERWQAVYQSGIVENAPRNAIIAKLARDHAATGDKVLVLVSRIEHGQALREDISDRATWCEWLSGREPLDRRSAILATFKEMKTGAVLVASPIFDEGVDIPQLDALVLAGAGESTIKLMQRVGRALRPRPDKDQVIIYDFLDGVSPIKGVKVEHTDYLALHSRQRYKDYEKEEFEVQVLKDW